jgi:hypothetical protein
MKNKNLKTIYTTVILATIFLAPPAMARSAFSLSVDLGGLAWGIATSRHGTYVSASIATPVVYAPPAPVVTYAPPVVYMPPAPVVVQPRPVVCAPPAPVLTYTPPAVVYAPPAPVVLQPRPVVVYRPPAPVVARRPAVVNHRPVVYTPPPRGGYGYGGRRR